jgi:DNA-binding LytR/AlgR family response regulator
MNNLKAIIIDDEPLAHKVILQYAEDVPFLNIVGQCCLATEAYTILNDTIVDLIFLDINMPKLNGLDFLRTLNQRPYVIVTSAYQEYALEGYELQVTDYLLKPFRFDRFLKAVNAVKNKIVKSDANEPKNIFIKVDRKHVQVAIDQIQYIESYGNYVKIWIGREYHLTPRTMSSFEEELKDSLIRIHKSFLIQKSFIEYVEGNSIVMKNGNQVSVGKVYKNDVKHLF